MRLVFDRKTIENHLQGELDLGRLQTSREQNGRVRLFEEYIFNVAIPLEDEFSTKSRTTIDNMRLGRRSTARTAFGLSF